MADTVIAERLQKIRLQKIASLSLKQGAHSPDSTFCVMEAVAFVAGEPWSDHPQCVSPVIAAFLRSWNDALPDDAARDRLLKPMIPKLVGTNRPELEERRACMLMDWTIRVHTSAWLRLAKLNAQADILENLPKITKFENINPIRPALEAVRKDANAAGAAAWAAAGDAARDAAWAAARAAAWDAAWAAARAAARDAAWDAARAAAWAAARAAAGAAAWAAARDAARAAAGAAARDALKPTVDKLQSSAVELVERMISVQYTKESQ